MSPDFLYRDMSLENDFSPKDGVSPETSTETFVLDLDVYQMIQVN